MDSIISSEAVASERERRIKELESKLFGKSAATPDQSDDTSFQRLAQKRKPVWEDNEDELPEGSEKDANTPAKEEKQEEQDDSGGEDYIDLLVDPGSRKLRRTQSERYIKMVDYEKRLREQYEKLNPRPDWMDSSGNDRQVSTSVFGAGESKPLRGEILRIQRLLDVNEAERSRAVSGADKSVLKVVRFHPHRRMVLTAGTDKILRFFNVSEGEAAGGMGDSPVPLTSLRTGDDSMILSVKVKDMAIHSAEFTADGARIYISGSRNYFYVYDVRGGALDRITMARIAHGTASAGKEFRSLERLFVSRPSKAGSGEYVGFLGKSGVATLISQKNHQIVHRLRMNGVAASLAFSSDENVVYTAEKEGSIYIWDLRRAHKCLSRMHDEGNFGTTLLAADPRGDHLAVGSNSGVVNIYRTEDLTLSSGVAKPAGVIDNLTTKITTLKFNGDGQVLLMASSVKQDALRMAYVPTFSVFNNWPSSSTPLRYVHTADFSPHGSYLALGNNRGRGLLYHLLDYSRY